MVEDPRRFNGCYRGLPSSSPSEMRADSAGYKLRKSWRLYGCTDEGVLCKLYEGSVSKATGEVQRYLGT